MRIAVRRKSVDLNIVRVQFPLPPYTRIYNEEFVIYKELLIIYFR
jgi:hypothetical protein